MKTAISLPDDVFEEAERLASRLKVSRSELYAQALQDFVRRQVARRGHVVPDDAAVAGCAHRARAAAGGFNFPPLVIDYMLCGGDTAALRPDGCGGLTSEPAGDEEQDYLVELA